MFYNWNKPLIHCLILYYLKLIKNKNWLVKNIHNFSHHKKVVQNLDLY